jgi:type I restriction enzyme S subunit
MHVESIIGDVPVEWRTTSLGAACREGGGDVQTGPFGSQLHAADYVQVGIPSIMPQNIGDNRVLAREIARVRIEDAERLSRYRVRPGDIVYSRRGDVERRALIRPEEDGWLCGTGCLRIRFGDGPVNSVFASYYLGHPAVREWIVRHAIGATMPNLNTSILSAMPIVIPPMDQQAAIARALGALDDKIDLNHRMNETLERMARAIFKSWFVDFDPVRAKLDGRPVGGRNSAVASLFPEYFDDTDDLFLPHGWRVSQLGDHVELIRGNTYKSKLKNLPGPYLLGLGSIRRNGGFRDDSLHTYGGDSAPRIILHPGDLFVSLKDVTQAADLLGAVARVPADIAQGRLTQDTVRLVPRGSGISFVYLYWTLLRPEYRHYCRARATGTTNLGLSRADFLSYPVLVPPPAIQTAFTALGVDVEAKIANNRDQNRTLAALRDTLLPKLLSGELRIRDAEKQVEVVV